MILMESESNEYKTLEQVQFVWNKKVKTAMIVFESGGTCNIFCTCSTINVIKKHSSSCIIIVIRDKNNRHNRINLQNSYQLKYHCQRSVRNTVLSFYGFLQWNLLRFVLFYIAFFIWLRNKTAFINVNSKCMAKYLHLHSWKTGFLSTMMNTYLFFKTKLTTAHVP